jgi:hypothetical protein
MLIPKKSRFDFYKAIQAAQFHTATILDKDGEIPGNEAVHVEDYLDKLIFDLGRVKEKIAPFV